MLSVTYFFIFYNVIFIFFKKNALLAIIEISIVCEKKQNKPFYSYKKYMNKMLLTRPSLTVMNKLCLRGNFKPSQNKCFVRMPKSAKTLYFIMYIYQAIR